MRENGKEYLNSLNENIKIKGIGAGDKVFNRSTEAYICMGLGDAFSAGCFRYGFGGVMAFTGTHYIRIVQKDLEFIIKRTMKEAGIGDLYIVNSIKKAADHVILTLMDREYRPKKNLVSFENAVLDLDTMDVLPHSEKLETNVHLPYDYSPRAECPRFNDFIMEVLPNGGAVTVLQEFCGAMFVDRKKYKIENMCFLVGTGRNGKGVFSSAIKTALGKENYTSFSMNKLISAEKNIAEVNGKLANICDDQGKQDISGGDFKIIVSGEPMPARRIFEAPFTAYDIPLMMAAVNEMPVTTDHTLGHHRRPLPIPFTVTIPLRRVDTELQYRLEAEVSGIFNWILEGRQRFIRNGGKFSICEAVENAKATIKTDSNSVFQFLEAKGYVPYNGRFTQWTFKPSALLFQEYRDWCREEGKTFTFEKTNFCRIMRAEGFVAKHKTAGNGFIVFFPEYGKTMEDVKKAKKEDDNEGKEPLLPIDDEGNLYDDDEAARDLPF